MHPTQDPVSPAPVEPTPADTLRHASLYLTRHGWFQGTYYRPGYAGAFPPACATGAIIIAVAGEPVNWPCTLADTNEPAYLHWRQAIAVLCDYLPGAGLCPVDDDQDEDTGDGWDDVWRFNDTDGQTAPRVVEVLLLAADEYDRVHGGAR